MGYEVHITRRPEFYWDEVSELMIPLLEWENYAENDPEMILEYPSEMKTADGTIVSTWSEGSAEWERNRAGINNPCFHYFEGNISVKNPNEETLEKMYDIAAALGAYVQGDDGEIYERGKKPYYKGDDNKDAAPEPPAAKPFWKFW